MMDTLLQQLINGLTVGGIYALIALGYTMVYGVLLLINFAHGDIFMVGAFLGVFGALLGAPSDGRGKSPAPQRRQHPDQLPRYDHSACRT